MIILDLYFSCASLPSRVFGHISYRSDWELVKVDFRQSFPRQCTEADYDSWKLTDLKVPNTHTFPCLCKYLAFILHFYNQLMYTFGPHQGEKCIMGQERSFRKRKDTAFCIKGKSYTSALTTKTCQCSEKDFNW